MRSPVIIRVSEKTASIVAVRAGAAATVVAQGRNLQTVLRNAAKAGAKEPMLVFVPRQNTRYVF